MNMQSETSYPLRKTRDFGLTISDTLLFVKGNWKGLLLMYFIFIVPFLVVGTLVGAESLGEFFYEMFSKSNDIFSFQFMEHAPMVGLSLLCYMIAGVLYPTLVYIYMERYEAGEGQTPTLQECASRLFLIGLSNCGYVLVTSFGFILMAMIIVIPVLGAIIFIFGFFYLVVAFSMLIPVNTIEDRPFPFAYRRSIELVMGRWWYTLGVTVVLFLIYYFFAMIIGFVSTMVSGLSSVNFLDPNAASQIFTKKYFLVSGLSAIVQQIFYLLIHVGLGIHYFSLREDKDGTGLEARLDQLGNDSRKNGHPDEEY
jgi:hypothetical protein